ncbi:MAG: Zn-dependent hydrolase [Synergistaceae bacterium]|jgi:allantoate deiminase/N-carbamoyl-L-amino-acid hydrolase|nr:Zn-dependent hydrolase [Synergistaceae bacterium]
MKTNGARVVARLEEIYRCGELSDGSHSRLAFSEEDQKGRNLFASYFRALGLECACDAAGNMIARLEGQELEGQKPLPAILIGSHMDTVPDGGKYDGALGCVAGLEVVETLLSSGEKLLHPLEVIVFADEEGARFGSGMIGSSAFCGAPLDVFSPTVADGAGVTRAEALAAFGVDWSGLEKAVRDKASVFCSLELHIEQGASLFRNGVSIGAVTAIAGVKRREVTIMGQKNHAGSTLMSDRKDALLTGARFIASVPEVVTACGGAYSVATVGMIAVRPNAVNVIPGSCVFSLEIRDGESSVIERIDEELLRRLAEIAKANGTDYVSQIVAFTPPAPMDERVTRAVAKAAEDAGYSCALMPSGAFHDSLMLARSFPCGMIFIPSVNGVSHSPEEFSKEEDIQKGCDVLLTTVLDLDKSPIG